MPERSREKRCFILQSLLLFYVKHLLWRLSIFLYVYVVIRFSFLLFTPMVDRGVVLFNLNTHCQADSSSHTTHWDPHCVLLAQGWVLTLWPTFNLSLLILRWPCSLDPLASYRPPPKISRDGRAEPASSERTPVVITKSPGGHWK